MGKRPHILWTSLTSSSSARSAAERCASAWFRRFQEIQGASLLKDVAALITKGREPVEPIKRFRCASHKLANELIEAVVEHAHARALASAQADEAIPDPRQGT